MNSRDVKATCKGRVDPHVARCIEALAEQQSMLRQQIRELAQYVDRSINIINNVVHVATRMKEATERMDRIFPAEKQRDN